MILNIISNAREKSKVRSVELYAAAIEQAIARYELKNQEKVVGVFETSDDGKSITIGEKNLIIDYTGVKTKGTIYVTEDGKVYIRNIFLDNIKTEYKYRISPLKPKLESGEALEIGSKYSIQVNDSKRFNFYILNKRDTNEDGNIDTYDLIMDRNICSNGEAELNECIYDMYESNDNRNGPTVAFSVLHTATKGWTNVPDMIMDYYDSSPTEAYGYTSIITDPKTKITTITGKPTSNISTIGNTDEPLKARLPISKELTDQGCTTSDGSCPAWLVDHLRYADISNDKYALNTGNRLGIEGYRILKSNTYAESYCSTISYLGKIFSGNYRNTLAKGGIRPVITVSTYLID